MPVLKNLAEILLAVPLFWGSVAFVGWLIHQDSFWINLGFVALGIGMLTLLLAMGIWALRMFHPRFTPPPKPWTVPVLAMIDILAVGVYFTIALSLPLWTRITLENTGSQPVTAVEIDCMEEIHRRDRLDPRQHYRISCIPEREGALRISWFSGDTRHAVQLGYLTPGSPQKLHLRIDDQGEIEGL